MTKIMILLAKVLLQRKLEVVNLLTSMAGFFDFSWERTVAGFNSFSHAIEVLRQAIDTTLSMTGLLPPIIGASLVIVLSIMVVRFLLLK